MNNWSTCSATTRLVFSISDAPFRLGMFARIRDREIQTSAYRYQCRWETRGLDIAQQSDLTKDKRTLSQFFFTGTYGFSIWLTLEL